VQPRAARLASRLLAASLVVAPCLVWGVDPQASMRFDNPAVGPAVTFATGHATPAGRTFADAVADPRTTAIEASAFGQSKADAHAAPTSFARGFAMTEAAASVDIATPVTAVPEPRTYVLMLVGLGALVFVARRRRRVE
jgi:hypothetical protein